MSQSAQTYQDYGLLHTYSDTAFLHTERPLSTAQFCIGLLDIVRFAGLPLFSWQDGISLYKETTVLILSKLSQGTDTIFI